MVTREKRLQQQGTEYTLPQEVYVINRNTAKVGGLTATFASLVVANGLGLATAPSITFPTQQQIYASTESPAFLGIDANRLSYEGISFGQLAQLLFPNCRELSSDESNQHAKAFGSFFS